MESAGSAWLFLLLVVVVSRIFVFNMGVYVAQGSESQNSYVSAIGDPGMKSSNVRVGLEAWNFCNEVGEEAPGMGSPRMADCADLHCRSYRAGNVLFPLRIWLIEQLQGIRLVFF